MTSSMANSESTAPPAKPTLYRTASRYASQAYSATVQVLRPVGESVQGYGRDAYDWAKQGGTWRMILLATAAALLFCVLGAVLSLVAVTAAVGCSLLFFTALLGLGALVTFLVARCSFAFVVFAGSALAAAVVIGVVASAAVCCVILTSVWVLGAWAALVAAQTVWNTASALLTKSKKGQ